MHFVFPLFLIALLTLVIPILIHLFYFRRYKRILFSDISFLKEVQEEKSTIEQLKKRLILAMRLAALFFLVMAFAQPFFGKKNRQQLQGNSAVCLYIDNSYSADLKKGGESILSILTIKAKEIVSGYGATDKFCLVTNDVYNQHQRWMNKQDFLDALDEIKLASQQKNLDEVLKKQNGLLNTISATNKTRIILSDFQKSMMSITKDTLYPTYLIPIQTNPEKNLFADSCWFQNPTLLLNKTNKLLVRLHNSGKSAISKTRVSVKVNQQVKAVKDIIIGALSTITDSFNITISQPGIQRLEISFNDYPITFDDKLYGAFEVRANEKVLCINGNEAPNNIQAIFGNDAYFQFTQNSSTQIDYSLFAQYQFIALNHIEEISSGLAAAIQSFLTNGGNVLFIPAKNGVIASYNNFLGLLQAGTFSNIAKQAGYVKQLNLNEKVFSGVFNSIPKNIDLPKFKQYYSFAPAPTVQNYPILISNSSTPLLSKLVIEKGLLYIQTTPLHVDYSDLGNKAIYPPMVYNMALYKNKAQPLYYTIGKDNLIELQNSTTTTENLFTLKSEQNEFVPECRLVGNSMLLGVNSNLTNDGIYTLYQNEKSLPHAVAFNFGREESLLEFATINEIKQRYQLPNFICIDNKQSNLKAQVKQIENGTILWKVGIVLSLLFLLAESLIIRFMK